MSASYNMWCICCFRRAQDIICYIRYISIICTHNICLL